MAKVQTTSSHTVDVDILNTAIKIETLGTRINKFQYL